MSNSKDISSSDSDDDYNHRNDYNEFDPNDLVTKKQCMIYSTCQIEINRIRDHLDKIGIHEKMRHELPLLYTSTILPPKDRKFVFVILCNYNQYNILKSEGFEIDLDMYI